MATLLLTSIIVCVIACAIAITTSDQTINLSALTGNLCRVSSNADVFPHAKYRHRFHRCSEPVVFVISPSPLVMLILIIRGGDVSRNPGPIKRQCSAGCGKWIIASSKAISCDGCDAWTHARCSDSVSVRQYDRLVQQQATFNYLCNACLISKLPFTDTQDDEADVDVSLDSSNDIYKVFCRKGLHFVHLNIRSLPPSIDEIRTIATKTKAAVIALTETWLDDSVNDSELRINNYCLIRADRNRQGGGVCLFIRENLTFNRRLDIITDSIETLWVEILQPNIYPFFSELHTGHPAKVICTIYLNIRVIR